MSKQSFADLGVSRPVVDALTKRGIHEPFEVQRLCIADVLAGKDVLVQSPTGSGKTLAFGVPMADLIAAEARRPAALVLAPTRELAEQINDELFRIAHSRALRIQAVFGGVGIEPQLRGAKKAHIVVATPGRLEDLMSRGLDLSHVNILVLDEADRMLDMGFKPPVDRIVSALARERQTLFFSATLEGAAGELAAAYTQDARTHRNAPEIDVADVSHRFVLTEHGVKVRALVRELHEPDRGRALVFVRTKRGADRLVKNLAKARIRAVAMHGDKSQGQRRRALAQFEDGSHDTLVATDVAARGIDVANITHVINYDIPEDHETYVHRTGRTARAGASGVAATLVLPDQYGEMRKMVGALDLTREFDDGVGTNPHGVNRGEPKGRPQQGGRNGGGNGGGNARSGGARSAGQGGGRNGNSQNRSGGSGGARNGQSGGGSGGSTKYKARRKQRAGR